MARNATWPPDPSPQKPRGGSQCCVSAPRVCMTSSRFPEEWEVPFVSDAPAACGPSWDKGQQDKEENWDDVGVGGA